MVVTVIPVKSLSESVSSPNWFTNVDPVHNWWVGEMAVSLTTVARLACGRKFSFCVYFFYVRFFLLYSKTHRLCLVVYCRVAVGLYAWSNTASFSDQSNLHSTWFFQCLCLVLSAIPYLIKSSKPISSGNTCLQSLLFDVCMFIAIRDSLCGV